MVIVRLIGGLGNQMFQYAAGRRAAYVNNSCLKLDITGYDNQEGMTKREYLLHSFNIKEDFATLDEIQKLKGLNGNIFFRYLLKLNKRIIPYYKQSYVKQKYFYFDPNILKVGKNTYLEGYWPSEKYFKDIKDIIKKEFTFKDKPNSENKKIIKEIQNSLSVSIHIRRGDYVNDQKTKQYHGICGLNYYHKAISIITKKIASPHFFVFSDDPQWTKENIKSKQPMTFITHNFPKKDYEDLRLMSSCQHNITANSSFSWWGAWLNQNPDKIVIAPKRWFRDPTINTDDLIPKSWIRI